MKHKNRNGLSVAQGMESVLSETLPRSTSAAGMAATPRHQGNGNGGVSSRAGTLAPVSRVTEPRSYGRPTHEQIERRAYELYLSRQGREGTAQEDWLQAERELSAPATST